MFYVDSTMRTMVCLSECFYTRAPWCVILLPVQEEVLSVNNFYTDLVFLGESIMEKRRSMGSQAFYRIDSDYTKERYSRSSAVRFFTTPVSLSSDLSTVLLLCNACGSQHITNV